MNVGGGPTQRGGCQPLANAQRLGRRSYFTDTIGERDFVEAKNNFLAYDKSPPKAFLETEMISLATICLCIFFISVDESSLHDNR